MINWKYVEGFNKRYRVSERGDVESCCRPGGNGLGDWKPLSLKPDKYGYLITYLWDTESQKAVRIHVHRLVAMQFLKSVDGKDCVNHKDGIKLNNHYSNLEWCTRQENMKHAWKNGLCKPHKLNREKAEAIKSYPANDTVTAERFGVSQPWVTKIRAGLAWK